MYNAISRSQIYVLDQDGAFLRKIDLATGVSTTPIGNAALDYWQGIREQLEQDGPYSSATTASLVNGTQFLVMAPGGLYFGTKFGIRWMH